MSDEELARQILALGVGGPLADGYTLYGELIGDAYAFVHDWRTAGALLEKMAEDGVSIACTWPAEAGDAVETCVAALQL